MGRFLQFKISKNIAHYAKTFWWASSFSSKFKKSCPRSKNILGGRIFQFRKSNLRTYKNIRKFSNTKQTPSENKYVEHDNSDKQKQTIRQATFDKYIKQNTLIDKNKNNSYLFLSLSMLYAAAAVTVTVAATAAFQIVFVRFFDGTQSSYGWTEC